MLTKLSDIEKTVRNVIMSLGLEIPYTYDPINFSDASAYGKGLLLSSDATKFLLAENVIFTSRRAGPSLPSPTRYTGTLVLSLYSKTYNQIPDTDFLESLAMNFAEKTIDWIRYRVFTPHTPMMFSGFTVLSGAVDFEFELYRGATP